MENNFNLKKFLIENKLTSNSRLLSEQDFAPSPNAHLGVEDGDYPVEQAFLKAGIDMSKDVHVYYIADRHGTNQKKFAKNATQVAEYIEKQRLGAIEDFNKHSEDTDFPVFYGYENHVVFPEDIPDGTEYKLTVAIPYNEQDYVITQ